MSRKEKMNSEKSEHLTLQSSEERAVCGAATSGKKKSTNFSHIWIAKIAPKKKWSENFATLQINGRQTCKP